MTLQNLEEYCEPDLPPECLLDPYNPANDQYYQVKTDLERRIIHASAILKPKQVLAVKGHFSGKTNKAIAETIGLNPITVGRYIRNAKAKRLLSLLRHYAAHLDGPNTDHRKSFLWRIAVDNREEKPTVAISAISEINRMAGIEANQQANTQGGVTVIVQHNVLEKGALDG